MRKVTLALLALLMTASASLTTARRANAQVCPLCVIGKHCCIMGTQAVCVPNSNPCV